MSFAWRRRDWGATLGRFERVGFAPCESQIETGVLTWTRIEVPVFHLSRRAALLVLQGMSLGALLIPNHQVMFSESEAIELAHLVVRVEPFTPYEPAPRLRDLVLARLDHIPDDTPPISVLSAIAEDAMHAY